MPPEDNSPFIRNSWLLDFGDENIWADEAS
jgi:hypothetical protein